MNPIFQEAARSAQGGGAMGVVTLLFLAFFAAVSVWIWLRGQRGQLEEISRMPLDASEPGDNHYGRR